LKGKEKKSQHKSKRKLKNRKPSEEDPLPLSEWVEDGKPFLCSITA